MDYLEGGLAAALQPPEEEELPNQGVTTPPDQLTMQGILSQYEETAEESRLALQEARDRLLGKKFDNRKMWLAAAQALGAPTRTGQFGETLGNLAGSLNTQFGARDKFESDKEAQLLKLNDSIRGVDQGLIGGKFGLLKYQEAKAARLQAAKMAKEEKDQKRAAQNLTHEAGMRKEFNTLLKDYEKVADAYGRVKVAGKKPSAAGDLAMIFNFMKMLDPGSTVREGEFATAANSAGVQGRVVTLYNNLLSGERLNPEQRADFLSQAQGLYDTAHEGAELKADSYRALATRNGLDPGDITSVFETAKSRFTEISVPTADGGRMIFPAGTSQEVMDREVAADNAKTAKEREGKEGFAEGGSVGRKAPPESDSQAPLEEHGESTLEQLLEAVGGAGAGAGVAVGGIEVEKRLMDLLRPELTRGTAAERKVVEAMEMNNQSPSDVMLDTRRGRRLGVPETPLDTGGPMTRVLGEKAIIAGDVKAEEALSALEERHEGSRSRVRDQIQSKFKAPEYFAEEDKLTNRLYERAKPAYEKAWAENPSLSHPPFWKKMVGNRYGEQAIHMALDFMDDIAQEPIGKKNIAGWVERPSLKFLDQVKRGFDQLIRKEENMGATPLGRHLRGMRSTLVTWLDNPKNTTPAYANARKQYKGDLEVLEALDTGRTQFLKMPTEEAKRLISGMAWAEKNALRAGVTQRLYEQLDAPTTDINAARKILGSPGTSDKLKLLFDKPKDFEVFEAALKREMKLFQEGKKLIGRSERGRTRRMTQEFLEQDDTASSLIRAARKFKPTEWVMRLFDKKKFRLSADEADEIITILNEGDLKELQQLEARLTKVAASRKRKKAPIRKKGRAAAVGALLGSLGTFLGDDEGEDDE